MLLIDFFPTSGKGCGDESCGQEGHQAKHDEKLLTELHGFLL
jgi:hypothetical protein